MSNFIGLIIVALVLFGASKFKNYWQSVKAKQEQGDNPARDAGSAVLPGLPSTLETSLQAAQKQGAAGLRPWLKQYRSYLQDPRLAQIELDYVVMVASSDPAEAKRVFDGVKSRVQPGSPMYDRVKKLEKTYQ